MEFKLSVNSLPEARIDLNRYKADLDDIRSLIHDICASLKHHIRFSVSGFGQDVWPVDVETDFMTFIEQAPNALHRIRSREDCAIDLYEQGMERILEFEFSDQNCCVTCRSRTDWNPAPETEMVSIATLDQMLDDIFQKFIVLAKIVVPDIQQNEWFVSWQNGEFEA